MAFGIAFGYIAVLCFGMVPVPNHVLLSEPHVTHFSAEAGSIK